MSLSLIMLGNSGVVEVEFNALENFQNYGPAEWSTVAGNSVSFADRAAVFQQLTHRVPAEKSIFQRNCLDRLIPIGERHFRRAVTEYVEHYHEEWNHQGSTIVSSHARW